MRSREEIEKQLHMADGPVRDPVLEVLLDNRDLMQQLVRELSAHDREMKVLAQALQTGRATPGREKK